MYQTKLIQIRSGIIKLPYTTMDRWYNQHGLQNRKQVYRTFQNATTILNFAEKEYGTHEFLKWICPLCPFRCTSCRLMSLKYLIITVMTCCNSIYHITMTYNEPDGVSNHQPHDCLLNRLFRRRSNKTPKLRVTGLCRASYAENVTIWWRHHEIPSTYQRKVSSNVSVVFNCSKVWYFIIMQYEMMN